MVGLGDSKVSQPGIPVFLEHYILWFEVFVDDIVVMDVFQSQNNTSCDEFQVNRQCTDLFLLETLFVANMVPEVPTSEVIHDQIEIDFILEGTFHIDDERVTKRAEYFSLVEH